MRKDPVPNGSMRMPDAGMRKYFVPQPDITTYELSYILMRCGGGYGLTSGIVFTKDQWDAEVPRQIKRHFQDSPDKAWRADAPAQQALTQNNPPQGT